MQERKENLQRNKRRSSNFNHELLRIPQEKKFLPILFSGEIWISNSTNAKDT
jgi:hypothetical protein